MAASTVEGISGTAASATNRTTEGIRCSNRGFVIDAIDNRRSYQDRFGVATATGIQIQQLRELVV